MLCVFVLCGVAPVSWNGATAQSATPTAFQGNPCLDGAAQAATQAADSPIYDYVILLDVSGSMEGIQNGGGIDPTKIIMPAVKESLKKYLSELQPGSQVTLIPFTGQINADDVLRISIGDTSSPDNALVEADAYIDGIVAGQTGGTFITDAITYGLDELAQSRDDDRQHIQTMLLFTDGEGNGPTDLDANNDFIVDNLLDAIDEYKREQPYLFVKYVSLGVAVPDAAEMEERGVDVVESAEGVPPVREVRVAIVPDRLSELEPGVPAANLLCAISGEVGADGVQVVVNDDPSELPADVQIAFRSEGDLLTADGLPLTYTLAGAPTSGLGPFTTYVEVKSADPEVLINPSRLPVTVTLADPTPAVTLDLGEFAAETRTRGVDAGDVTFTLPLNLTAPDGGGVALSLDTADLAGVAPGASASFAAGSNDLGETATLSAEQPSLDLNLAVPAAALDALADGAHTLPVGVIITPQDAEVTITGAAATPQPGGSQRVTPGAALTLNPQPVCGLEAAPVPGQVLLEGDQSADAVRWETTVTLSGRDGCAGTLTFDDSALQQAIPGARAAFDVNGEAPLQLDLGDGPARVLLVVTAPRASVLALEAGDHPQTVDLVASTPARLSPPDGLTPNDAGAYVVPVTLPLVIGDRPGVTCQIPSFDLEEIIADGSQDPPITRSGELTCTFAGDVSASLRIAGQDDGVTATLSTADAAPGRTVTLDPEHPSATLTLEVDRSVPQAAGEGTHTFTAQIEAQASSRDADLELDGQPATAGSAVSSDAELQVRVVGEKVITIAPFDLTPDPVKISTFDTEPDPLEWRGEIAFELSNGADGTLQIDLPADSPVTAFFKAGETTLSGPIPLAGQRSPIELVVQMPLATAQALAPDDQPFDISLTLDPQGARVDAPDFARADALYRDTETATLRVTAPPVAEVSSPSLAPAAASTSHDQPETVRIASQPLEYTLKDGARVRLDTDDGALADAIPGASAGFSVGGGEPVSTITLAENGQDVSFVILIPRSSLTAEGPLPAPSVDITTQRTADNVVLFQDGTPVPTGKTGATSVSPDLTVSIPDFTIDLGKWTPDILGVPIDSVSTGALQWERTLTASELADGARPSVTITLDDPILTARLYDGAITEDKFLAEGTAGVPATAYFEPGHERIIAVISAPAPDLRALGLNDRQPFPAALTIDPRGALGSVTGQEEGIREPLTLDESVVARIYQPFPWLRVIGLVLLAILLAVLLLAAWPRLPKNAAIKFEDQERPLPRGGAVLGKGGIQIGTSNRLGEIRGAWWGAFTRTAKFKAATDAVLGARAPVAKGARIKLEPGKSITEPDSGVKVTYIIKKVARQRKTRP